MLIYYAMLYIGVKRVFRCIRTSRNEIGLPPSGDGNTISAGLFPIQTDFIFSRAASSATWFAGVAIPNPNYSTVLVEEKQNLHSRPHKGS
jgi:hypothetical protein